MENNTAQTEKSISERLSGVWRQLSRNQQRFVIASLEEPNKRLAAEAIDIKPDTVYRWPEIVDEAISLARDYTKDTAIEILAQSLAKAAMVKVGGLDSDDEKIRQAVATEILDRKLGKPSQPMEHTGAGGEPLGLVILPAKKEPGNEQ
jgi:hypothetical protein